MKLQNFLSAIRSLFFKTQSRSGLGTKKTIHVELNNFAKWLERCGWSPRNGKVYLKETLCCLSQCPLQDRGQCADIAVGGGYFCPYGTVSFEDRKYERSMEFMEWLKLKKKEAKEIAPLSPADAKMEFVGDYVFLPYESMCDDRSLFPYKIIPFLERRKWTRKTVLKLIRLMESTPDGRKECSVFVEHLRERDEQMWTKLMKVRPELMQRTERMFPKSASGTS